MYDWFIVDVKTLTYTEWIDRNFYMVIQKESLFVRGYPSHKWTFFRIFVKNWSGPSGVIFPPW